MGQATYDAGLSTAKDRLRRLLGDVDPEYPLLDDATYDGAVSQYGEAGAAVFLAESLAAEYAQLPVRTDDNGVALDFSERVRTWQALAATMRANPSPGGAAAVSRTSVLLAERAVRSSTTDEYGRPATAPHWWPL